MKSNNILREQLNLRKWQEIQERYSNLIQQSIILVDDLGDPISVGSNRSKFCRYVEKQEDFESDCEKCMIVSTMYCAHERKPFAYECYLGITSTAVPIYYKKAFIGAIIIGQVRITDEKAEKILPKPLMIADKMSNTSKSLYNSVPLIQSKEMSSIVSFTEDLAMLITSSLFREDEFFDNEATSAADDSPYSLDIISDLCVLLEENPDHYYTLNELSQIYHLTPNYLGSYFKKRLGVSFTKYYHQKKVDEAMEFLKVSDDSITVVADKLGFSDSNYFSKVFKSQTGITPSTYRKQQSIWLSLQHFVPKDVEMRERDISKML